jgi:[ribosomal protein S5]-alanine N-acetyltransferase
MESILETERLALRYQTAADVDFLIDLWSDPEVTRFLGGPREKAQLRTIFQKTAANPKAEAYDLWPLVEKAGGALVGHCGLLGKDVEGRKLVELNYILHPTVRGRGYAVEIGKALVRYAHEVCGLCELIALIHPENKPSERTAERIGMHFAYDVTRPGGVERKVYRITLRPEDSSK